MGCWGICSGYPGEHTVLAQTAPAEVQQLLTDLEMAASSRTSMPSMAFYSESLTATRLWTIPSCAKPSKPLAAVSRPHL
jgi:hypothetical protein